MIPHDYMAAASAMASEIGGAMEEREKEKKGERRRDAFFRLSEAF